MLIFQNKIYFLETTYQGLLPC